MSLDWVCGFGIDPGWGTVIGGFFVTIAAWQATSQAEKQRRFDLHERQKSVTVAIASETRLLAKQIKERKWSNSLEDALSQWNPNLPGMNGPTIYTPLGRKFVRIYEANLQNIAMLGEHTHDVAEFYARVEAAIEVNDELKKIVAGGGIGLGPNQSVKLMTILKRMLSELENIGELLAKSLEASVAKIR